jgi:hypothetical protein
VKKEGEIESEGDQRLIHEYGSSISSSSNLDSENNIGEVRLRIREKRGVRKRTLSSSKLDRYVIRIWFMNTSMDAYIYF